MYYQLYPLPVPLSKAKRNTPLLQSIQGGEGSREEGIDRFKVRHYPIIDHESLLFRKDVKIAAVSVRYFCTPIARFNLTSELL